MSAGRAQSVNPHTHPGTMMTMRAIASFDVTGWEQSPYEERAPGPKLSRAKVRKTFRGDLAGESAAELLGCV